MQFALKNIHKKSLSSSYLILSVVSYYNMQNVVSLIPSDLSSQNLKHIQILDPLVFIIKFLSLFTKNLQTKMF